MEQAREAAEWLDSPSFHFDSESDSWQRLTFSASDDSVPACPARPHLRVLTYNVLFDKYDADKICTLERAPVIFGLLAASGADVMCLQEVTGSWLRMLLKQEWVRRGYWCSDGPEAASLGGEYGQVLLCKLPFRCRIARFSRYKMAVLAELQWGARRLAVAGVHLPSNYFDGADDGAGGVTEKYQQRREVHLAEVIRRLAASELHILMGDFNYDPQRDECADPEGYGDADSEQKRVTFDALNNTTAAITSRSGKQRRYDRILFAGGDVRATECSLVGTAVFATASGKLLCPSDHFGVACRLAMPFAVLEYAGGVAELLAAQRSRIGSAAAETERRMHAAAHIRGLLPADCTVSVVGSTALGCVMRDSDLDLAVAGRPMEEVRRALRGRIAIEEGGEGGGGLRVHTEDGLVVEMQEEQEGDEAARDVAVLLEAWGADREHYVAALLFVKLWAARLGLYGTVWGFPNGLAYAVMLTAATRGLKAVTADVLLKRFFNFFGHYDWTVPVRISTRYEARPHDWIPVGAPSTGRSVCRCATRSSLRTLEAALREAATLYPSLAQLLLQQRTDGLPLFFSAHPHYLRITPGEPRLALSRLPTLILFLERCGLECTAYPTLMSLDGLPVQLIGLSGPPPDCRDMLPGCVVAPIVGPVTCCNKKRFKFVAVLEQLPEAAAAHAPEAPEAGGAQQEEEAVDFAARVTGLSSDKIFAAVKWDPVWQGGLTEIVWEDRFLGFLRKPVAQFHPSAIPWHRVRAFYHKGQLIWWRGDREDFDTPPAKK